MSEYLTQLDRSRRFIERLRNQNRERNDYEDDLWSFFQNTWHLKDWIKNDPTVPQSVKDTIEEDIKQFDVLMICGDLANRSKHLKLSKIRKDAKVGGREIVVVAQETIGGSKSKVTQSWDYLITLGDGSTRKALDVAKAAIQAWETLLLQYGLDKDSDL